MLDAGATSMKSPRALNLHNTVTVSQKRMGKRVAQLSPARMNEVCAALRFFSGVAIQTSVSPNFSVQLRNYPTEAKTELEWANGSLDKISEVGRVQSRSNIVTRRWIIELNVGGGVDKILRKNCETFLSCQG
jgi:hypothetical protein